MIGPDQNLNDFPPWAWPRIRVELERLRVQEVINEQDTQRYLKGGWKFITETKSGRIIVEKFFSPDEVIEAGIKALREQNK
jgi:hypothetical protein